MLVMVNKKPQKICIGEEILPDSMKTEIFTRFLSERAMKDLWESYRDARHTLRNGSTPPTEMQYKIAQLRKTGMRYKEITAKLGVPFNQVSSAISRVAVWEYMNK